jgi:two-component system, LytTR family, response regulator
MIRILILEDEAPAAKRLSSLITQAEVDCEIVGTVDSVKATVKWLSTNPAPDLAFFDIQVADGLSFEVFDWVELPCPIIFCTAYDEYAIKAFKVNSIDYLLKPADLDEVKAALAKFKTLKSTQSQITIVETLQSITKSYKERFLVKIGEHIKTVATENIQYFYSVDKATFAHTSSGQNYLLDLSLEKVEKMVDPKLFFRINRKYLISIAAINDIVSYSNSRLRILLKDSKEMDAIVARERVSEFKSWLDR